MSPELKAVLDEYASKSEHRLPTGQEFLDMADNNMSLYAEYLEFWDGTVIPELVEKIKTQGTVEDARTLEEHSR